MGGIERRDKYSTNRTTSPMPPVSTRRKASLGVLAGSAGNAAIVSLQAIVLIPLYLKALGPTLYGAWLGSGDVLTWLQMFDLGLPNLMIQRIGSAHASGDEEVVGAWFATGTAVMALVSAGMLAAGLLVAPILPVVMHVTGSEAETLRASFSLGAVGASLVLFNNAFIGFSRAVQDTAYLNGALIGAAIVGFLTSLGLVLGGAGLWAIPVGVLARALVSLSASGLFVWKHARGGLSKHMTFARPVFRQLLGAAPATGLGGVSYAVMSQSDTVLVGALCGPAIAAAYSITKKPADVLRSIVDMIGTAAYGGFAHLVGGADRPRALGVRCEILAVRDSAAVLAGAVYLAANASLIGAWVGREQYAGDLLTALVGAHLVVAGGSYLRNYLFRAAGSVVQGSWMLAAETVVRLPLTAVALVYMGPPGAPLVAIVTAVGSGVVVGRLTERALSDAMPAPRLPASAWLGRMLVLAVGAGLGAVLLEPAWTRVAVLSAAMLVLGAGLLWATDRTLRGVTHQLTTQFLRAPR